MNQKSESLINQIFFNKYKVLKKVGQGSFGRIYSCQDINTKELYAMKVEENSLQNNVLETELKYLNYLKGFGIPEIKFFGNSEKYHILIETLLDKSLENLYSESHGNFNLKDISMIGIQVLDRLEYIHNKSIIHRDIKPDNFVIGKNQDKKTIYIIDFGLAKKYRNSLTLEHIPFKMTKRLTGTARYASVNALKGGEQSRKDDLESLAYMLLYFLKGSLPWQGVTGTTKGEKYKKIYYMKKNIGAEKLFEDLPNEFRDFYSYVKKLEFAQNPDYNFCRKLFMIVIGKNPGDVCDNFFTWCKEINILNKNYFGSGNLISNNETGKTLKSTKILNLCNSNTQLEIKNNKKIQKISITFIDKKNRSINKIMNYAYNLSLDKKRNIFNINKNNDNNIENDEKIENKEIIVTSNKSNNSNDDDYSIEGELENHKKMANKKNHKNNLNYRNNINILSLTRINKKNDFNFLNINKFNKNLNRTKTNKDLLSFTKKNFDLINKQLLNKTSRNKISKNRSNDSKNKSSNKMRYKNKTSVSNFYRDILNNSPKKRNKTRNKLISVYNTHTNIHNKNRQKIKYSKKNQKLSKSKSKSKSGSKNKGEKSIKKKSLLLDDFMNIKNNNKIQFNTSRTNDIKSYLKYMQSYGHRNSKISFGSKNNKNIITKDVYNISMNNIEIKNRENNIMKNIIKAKSKNNSKSRNEHRNINSLNKNSNKCHSISNKQLKVSQILSGKRSKRDIIININKCFKKRKKSNNYQKSDIYLNKLLNKNNNIFENRSSTINIESIVFVGDNNINQYSQKNLNRNSKSKSKNSSRNKKKKNSSPKNGFLKNYNKTSFLKKFKFNILTNDNKISNNIYNNCTSKIKKKMKNKNKNISYNNISIKLGEKKSKINSKSNINKNIINNYNTKKFGPISFNDFITKNNINFNNILFNNNSLIEKKFFIQNSFNSSDNNYILNNINNNNIIVNNYNGNNNSNISKKLLNSFSINNKNIFTEEINENDINNNFGGLSYNNSIFKDFMIRSNKNMNKKDNNSRQNIINFIKRFQKNNIVKDNKKQKFKKK